MNNSKIADKLPDNYDPLKDEIYMSPYMLRYFKDKLENLLREVLQKENEISHSTMEEPNRQPDHVDQGTVEELRFQDFMFQEHEEVLRSEIEEALQRINNNTFGYCKETGDPIGLKRLLTIPTAKYRVDIQEEIEKE